MPAPLNSPTRYSLDDLIALNDELVALCRAGVPLERGLLALSPDMPGRLRQLAEALGERMQRGESLPQALASQQNQIPPVYRAVVEAGARSGRLALALEQLAAATRRIADLRRTVGLAILYPLLIVSIAAGLFAWLGPQWVAMMRETHDAHQTPVSAAMNVWLSLVAVLAPAMLCLAPLLLVLAALWWWLTGSAVAARPAMAYRMLGWVPQLRGLLRAGWAAVFCEILSLLVEQGVPLHEALPLAAGASGNQQLTLAAEQLAARLKRGENIPPEDRQLLGLPQLAAWMMPAQVSGTHMAGALRSSAESYRQQAQRTADWLQVFLPVLLMLVIGGGIAMTFALSVFAPWSWFLHQLGQPL